MSLERFADAAAELEQAEVLDCSHFSQFDKLARCYIGLNRPRAAFEVCERSVG